jgi:hypothetical protein
MRFTSPSYETIEKIILREQGRNENTKSFPNSQSIAGSFFVVLLLGNL